MQQFESGTPVVMSLNSHDPSGCAGIQADIETAASLGCHCTAIITALCAKDTQSLRNLTPIEPGLIIEQARTVLEDMPVKAIKLGFMASVEAIEAVDMILADYPDIPVVLDPVTSEFNSEVFNAAAILRATKALLLPRAMIVTPDIVEAHELAKQADTADACGYAILESGCQYVLITGTARNHRLHENSLYGDRRLIRHYEWPRLNVTSHGGGATLAAAIAAYLAHGIRLEEAVQQAQKFSWEALAASRRLGMGCNVPNRMHWASKENKDSASTAS